MRDGDVESDVGMDGHHLLAQNLAIAAHRDLGSADLRTLIFDTETDRLRLPDDSEPRSLGEYHPTIDLVLLAGDQGVQRRRKPQHGRITRHVMHAAIGNQDGAGNAIRRNIRERGGKSREQLGAVGLPVGGAGFRHAHLHAGNSLQPLLDCGTDSFSLLRPVAETLTWALVDDDRRDRRDWFPVFARERGVGESQNHQRQRQSPQWRAAAAGEQQDDGNQGGDGKCRPNDVGRHQRSK